MKIEKEENHRFVCTKQEIWEENKKALLELEEEVKKEEERATKLSEFEKIKYEEFKKIAEEEDFFSLNHVKKLKLDWNILIVLSEKNVGKTTEKYRIIKEQIKNGRMILYGRATKADLLQEMQILKGDKQSPVVLMSSNDTYTLHEKVYFNPKDSKKTDNEESEFIDDEEQPPKKKKFYRNKYGKIVRVKEKNPRAPIHGPWEIGNIVGRGFCLKEANKLGGASDWSDYSYVLLDEVIPYDSKKILKDEHLYSWAAFMSSIVRNSNTGLKVVAFGNMLEKNSAFLSFYGIKRDDKLRYIFRGDDDGCKILFLNISNIYGKGFRNQKGVVQHAHPEFSINLKNNSILQSQLNIIRPSVYEKLKPIKAFILKEHTDPSKIDDYYICEIRESVACDTKTLSYKRQFLALKVFPLKSYIQIPGTKIFTDSFYVKNNFRNTTHTLNLNYFYNILKTNQIHNNLMFYDSESIRLIENLLMKTYKGKLI